MRTQGLVELGAFAVNRLRRSAVVEFFPWTSIVDLPKPKPATASKPAKKYDRMLLAYKYDELLKSGVVSTRAELARHLGVSRARVTQVLNRLKQTD